MPDREKYIEVLSKVAKTVKEFNEDIPIKISLVCVEDILELLKEQEEKIRQMPKPDQHEKKKTMLDEYLERPTEKAKRVADVISLQVQEEIERTEMLRILKERWK